MNYSGLQNIYGTVYNHQGFNGTPPNFFLSEIVDEIIPFLSLLNKQKIIKKEKEHRPPCTGPSAQSLARANWPS